MTDNSIEYSLNTPVFYNPNIFDKKIIEFVKNNNMGGGNGFYTMYTSSCISMIVGIIIIIIGFVLLWFKNDLVESEAIVVNRSCGTNSNNMNECKINITYTVDLIQYSKIITMDKSNISDNSTIKIYYQQSEPNSIQLVNPNYSVIGIGLVIVGLFVIAFSTFDNGLLDTTSQTTSSFNTGKSVYKNLANTNGYDVVYTV